MVQRFKALVKERTGKEFPTDPWDQLEGAIGAVFGSWMNDRAIVYRRKYNIPSEWGTAVSVQSMVFGNTGDKSGSGVAFTRDPATGEKVFYGEFLINAQGEDVVAGVRTPKPVAELIKIMPAAAKELEQVRQTLERHFRDVQDFEFTIEDGKVFMLQTRNGKRTGLAAVRFAVEMEKEKLITWEEAVQRVPAEQLDQVLAPVFDRAAIKSAKAIAQGLPAGPGAATGRDLFQRRTRRRSRPQGREGAPGPRRDFARRLARHDRRRGHSDRARRRQFPRRAGGPPDGQGLRLRRQRLAGGLRQQAPWTSAARPSRKGDFLSIDGTTGEVYAGESKTAPSEIVQVLIDKTLEPKESRTYQEFRPTDEVVRQSHPHARPHQRRFPRTGRQRHRFRRRRHRPVPHRAHVLRGQSHRRHARNDPGRQPGGPQKGPGQAAAVSSATTSSASSATLKGLPATIRTLDPPLHEFLPHEEAAQKDLAAKMGVPVRRSQRRVRELHEFNPMLGLRGCRLGIVYPEITEMQTRAIIEAAAQVQKEGIPVKPEIMIVLVGFPKELQNQLEVVHRVARQVQEEQKTKVKYLVGTMIEIPRGRLGRRRDRQGRPVLQLRHQRPDPDLPGHEPRRFRHLPPRYQELEIIKQNPFATIDQDGVGELVKMAVEQGRKTRPDIKLGICGEHGGDPASVKFCHRIGLTYVSCSPFRVPIARLAAAQAALEEKKARGKK